jgi:hypothetical protein
VRNNSCNSYPHSKAKNTLRTHPATKVQLALNKENQTVRTRAAQNQAQALQSNNTEHTYPLRRSPPNPPNSALHMHHTIQHHDPLPIWAKSKKIMCLNLRHLHEQRGRCCTRPATRRARMQTHPQQNIHAHTPGPCLRIRARLTKHQSSIPTHTEGLSPGLHHQVHALLHHTRIWRERP